MSLNFEFEVRNAQRIISKILRARSQGSDEIITEALSMADELIEQAKIYPAETDANRPPPPYYIRGTGYIGRHGTLTKLSENLKDKWTREVVSSGDTADVTIRNLASYSGYVQARDFQAHWHARTGWRTIEEIFEERRTDFRTRLVRLAQKLSNIIRRG